MNRLARAVAVVSALVLIALPVVSGRAQQATPVVEHGEIEIAYVLHGLNSFTEDMAAGAQDAADDYGVSLDIFDAAAFDVSVELDEFNAALQGGYDGIAVAPLDGERWVEPIQQAVDQGMPVVGFNVTSLGSALATWVGQDDYRSGKILGDEALRQLTAAGVTGGVVLVGSCNPDENVLQDRDAGLREVFAGTGFTLPATRDVQLAIPDNAAAWAEIVTAHPDLVMAIGLCYIDVPNLVQIKSDQGATWLIGGYNVDQPALDAVTSGDAQFVIDQQEYLQGYLPVAILADHLIRETPLVTGWIETPVDVVNAENIDAATAREQDNHARRDFYRAYIDAHFPDLQAAARPYQALRDLGASQATPVP